MKTSSILTFLTLLLCSFVSSAQWISKTDTIYTTNNIGIGTSTPKGKLHLKSNTANLLTFEREGDTRLFTIKHLGNGTLSFTKPNVTSSSSLSNFRFGPIGSISSYYPYWNGFQLLGHQVTIGGTINYPILSIFSTSTTDVNPTDYEVSYTLSNMNLATGLDFSTTPLSGSYIRWGFGDLPTTPEAMRITYDGSTTKLGIGTIAPTSKLEVLSGGSTSPIATFSNDKDATKDSTITIAANGNLGIGTISPTSKLHIAFKGTATLSPNITVENIGGVGGAGIRMKDSLSRGDWGSKVTEYGNYKIRDNKYALDVVTIEKNSAANALYIGPEGKLGIGSVVSSATPNNITISKTLSRADISDNININNTSLVNPMTSGSTTYYNNYSLISTAGSNLTSTNSVNGEVNYVFHYTSNNINGLRGNYNQVGNIGTGNMNFANINESYFQNNSTGSVHSVVGYYFQPQNNSTGTINGLNAMYLASPINNGTINYIRALSIANQSVGNVTNTPFAIYQEGTNDLNYFAGKVGIGTTTPKNKLHIYDASNPVNICLESPYTGTATRQVGAIVLRNSANGDKGLLTFRKSNGYSEVLLSGYDSITNKWREPFRLNVNTGNFSVGGNIDTINYINNGDIRFNNTGNVGIGIKLPTRKLDVVGSGKFSGTVIAAPAINSDELITKGQFETNSVFYNNSGVATSRYAGVSIPNSNSVSYLALSGTIDNYRILVTNEGQYGTVGTSYSNGFIFYHGLDGKVGVIKNNLPIYYFPSSTGNVGDVLTMGANKECYWSPGAGNNSGTLWNSSINSSDINYTLGKVGIGIASPSELLDVRGGKINVVNELRVGNNNQTSFVKLTTDEAGYSYLIDKNNVGFVFGNGNGKVGIYNGQTSYFLPNSDGTDGQLLATDGDGNCTWISLNSIATSNNLVDNLTEDGIGTTLAIGQSTDGVKIPWQLASGTINTTSKVIIGVKDPSQTIQDMLNVYGRINAMEVKVSLGTWSDYVFNPEYKLKPLNEVKTYIEKNRHLPEIPSEKEIKEDGLSLGEMNALLLKKVEELTLYILDQEKRIQKLEDKAKR